MQTNVDIFEHVRRLVACIPNRRPSASPSASLWRVLAVALCVLMAGPPAQGASSEPVETWRLVYPPESEWGEPITLHLDDVSVNVAMQTVAKLVGLSIVVPNHIKGNVSLHLEQVLWPLALEAIAKAAQVSIHQASGIYWVSVATAGGVNDLDLQALGKTDLVRRRGSEALGRPQPGAEMAPISKVFRLNYAQAAEVLKQLSSAPLQRAKETRTDQLPALSADGGVNEAPPGVGVTPRSSMWADVRSNQLFVVDTPRNLEMIDLWVQALDVPVRQVLIEARIVEADQNFSKQLGVRLGSGQAQPVTWGSHVGIGPSYEAVGGAAVGAALPFVTLPASGVNGYSAATFAVSLFGAGVSRFLNLEISALEADGNGKVVSSPHVVTSDRVKAVIQQGTEYPYQSTGGNGQISVEFRKASLKLEVTPRITPNGYVMLNLVVHKDSRGETTASGIAINTKQVQTEVLVEDGGTLVIGGILEEYERTDTTRVPVLGEIPWIGNVFKSTSKRVDKTEVVVFITPKVIENSR